MRNSNQPPPRYGAEGPPGGIAQWNQQRAAATGKKPSGLFGSVGEFFDRGNAAADRLQGRMAQAGQGAVEWGKNALQWPGRGGGGQPAQVTIGPVTGLETIGVSAQRPAPPQPPTMPEQLDQMKGQMGQIGQMQSQLQRQQQYAQQQAQASQPTASQRLLQQSRALRPRGVRAQEY